MSDEDLRKRAGKRYGQRTSTGKRKIVVSEPARRAIGRRVNVVRNPNTRDRSHPFVPNPWIAKAERRRKKITELAKNPRRSQKSKPTGQRRGIQ